MNDKRGVSDHEQLKWLSLEYDKRCIEVTELKGVAAELTRRIERTVHMMKTRLKGPLKPSKREALQRYIDALTKPTSYDAPEHPVDQSYYATTLGEAEERAAMAQAEADRQKDRAYRQIRKVNRLQEELDSWREREAACCPEDVGFDEFIKSLQKTIERLQVRIDRGAW